MIKNKKSLLISLFIFIITIFLLLFVKNSVDASSLLYINNNANSANYNNFKSYDAVTKNDLYVYHYGYNDQNHRHIYSKKGLKQLNGYEGVKRWYYRKLLKKGSKISYSTPGFKQGRKKFFTVMLFGNNIGSFQEGKGIYNAINIQSIHQLKNVKKSNNQ